MLDVRGQGHAKRALEVAAAGGHSLLMVGPPGTGKTMLASRLPGILPPMTEEEALASAAAQSLGTRGFPGLALAAAAVPRAASYGVGGSARGRRQRSASRRDFHGDARRVVPR